ncbi:tRNA dihydrouridine synthase-like flavin mononucleotide-binding domain protein [Syntrophotalea carbinolica DSM 2380]|uniref:tRNA dihydrouridine synthase-like flavin mononucleotide-binding domain protein n=1 Tax=Syntrophotalea carbinolica (strain DSM 2380 / NBRC 103641 / GraBd1) TaxID=338963 RepID=Q3A649_SYNC1|nr:tRNA-dihydrouridine synthase family protein [Syntrophotalea carbinolica]ABA88158.2 tRNA dihydrouridine synthase-like flavin mononucleotide-binding domain protein [Syntrophotalea carbinolica DSM 2380]
MLDPDISSPARRLPWPEGQKPLMLAPMQGLTNMALRAVLAGLGHPDVLFTEFVRVAPGRMPVFPGRQWSADCCEMLPLVVQLIGHDDRSLAIAAQSAQQAGARHINLNLGCPHGRMTSAAVGGNLLAQPERIAPMLAGLRKVVSGSFSVKLRAGYEDPTQIFSLLPMLEDAGVDFFILHPRTVLQGYDGQADHAITAAVAKRTCLPLIANGDIRKPADGCRLLEQTDIAGLMLGRGAIADPLLFERLRRRAPARPNRRQRAVLLRRYLTEVADRYAERFCGDTQVLGKLREILKLIDDPAFVQLIDKLKKCRKLSLFNALLAELE